MLSEVHPGAKVLQLGCEHTYLLSNSSASQGFQAYCVRLRGSQKNRKQGEELRVYHTQPTQITFEDLGRGSMDLVYSLQSLENALVPSVVIQNALKVTKKTIVLLERFKALDNVKIVEGESVHDRALHTWPRLLLGNLLVANGFHQVAVENLVENPFCSLNLVELVKTALISQSSLKEMLESASRGLDHCPLMAKAVKPPAFSEREAASHYDAQYWEYQLQSALANNPEERAAQIRMLFKPDFANDPHFTFLDIGCGGGFTPGLVGAPNALCIELNPHARAFGMKNFTNVKYYFPDEWYLIEDQSVDFIWSMAVLEHIPDYIDVLSHVDRVLKPGGKAHILLPAETTRNDLPASENDVDLHIHTWNVRHLWNAGYAAGMRGHLVEETMGWADYCVKPVKELFKEGPELLDNLKRWERENGEDFFYCYVALKYTKQE